MGLISEKMEVLNAELNERAEAANGIYSVTDDSLQYIYSVLMTKNHRNLQSKCLVHGFSFTDIFNDINHGYRAAILKKKVLLLLLFYMVVATYYCYEKVRRTMRTVIVSNLFNKKVTFLLENFTFTYLMITNSITPLVAHKCFLVKPIRFVPTVEH